MKFLTGVALVLLAAPAIATGPTSNATHYPLFDYPVPTLQTLHTSLATLLPMLPVLSPPPSHTLLLTLATPAIRPLLFNWMCFLRYKAKWGQPPVNPEMPQAVLPHADVPKVLIVTSDESLANELSELGVVVWYLRTIPWDDVLDEEDEAATEDDDWMARVLQDDLFLNLRLMDLLLPPQTAGKVPRLLRGEMIQWGSLHYQSLMLERTLVMSALTGALTEAQRVETEDRKAEDVEHAIKVWHHDWTTGHMPEEPFVGVKGILVVDNDAVWLSSPSSFLANPYRPTGNHPAVIFSPDMPVHSKNSYSTYSMPCACFMYTRTSDHLSSTASSLTLEEEDTYRPSAMAAQVWRNIALCHITMLLESLEAGRKQAAQHNPNQLASIEHLLRATAPSFQATALGPALFLSSQSTRLLPLVSHDKWMEALGSGVAEDLLTLLADAGLGTGGTTCVQQARQNHAVSPNPHPSPDSTSLTSPDPPHSPIRMEQLPYDMFPPGMTFFGGEREEGIKPCVVHANYAMGNEKESLLKGKKLWAIRGGKEEGWTCDVQTMRNA